MVGMKLYVEGGGDAKLLRTACRQGFSEFLKKAGLVGYMPRLVACGSRKAAYDAFCTAQSNGESAMLLVDSEDPINAQFQQPTDDPSKWRPWQHLLNRQGDQWPNPVGANDDHCHFMVQCMETWFIADRETLRAFFDPGFKDSALPAVGNNVELATKQQVYQSLVDATKDCKTKASYNKGEHSFKLLALINPAKVTAASSWAKRFVNEMKKQMGC